ncbi:hypothetical protein ADICYQ_5333 [Cyclobacterium qasimii M12-11B]|uniref:Uncharacterized protein n=1 Tax=Cyclobacterium qasimii M12-11B TaxID=641524 RepID=S7V6R5_9BACT|nr:hypothetical protein ADICYQ_5333 [Cyclobacterium qasimii M12-11B]
MGVVYKWLLIAIKVIDKGFFSLLLLLLDGKVNTFTEIFNSDAKL